ncbi:polar growth protein [Agyrium rufum]|nr:polar growth protein [Agyrium rufum]
MTAKIFRPLDDFEARSPDELSLRKGDRIELVERDDEFGDGWYLGKHIVDGRTGLFPEVYTTVLPNINTSHVTSERPTSISSAAIEETQRASSPEMTPVVASSAGSEADTQSLSSNFSRDTVENHNVQLAVSTEVSNATPHPLITNPQIQRTASLPSKALSSTSAPTSMPAQRSISMSMGTNRLREDDSPVINETLSVIDEHITDMNTPRSSLLAPESHVMNDSGSEYSAKIDNRLSYISGHETDEEEQNALTEMAVAKWTPEQVAEHLKDIGVDHRHCEVFQEQEISGEVLLGIDQATIFMKELDLGLVGRRLRTWHKIKALQEEIRANKSYDNHSLSLRYYGGDASSSDAGRRSSRASSNMAMLPIIPSISERPASKLSSYQPTNRDSGSVISRPISQAAPTPSVTRSPSHPPVQTPRLLPEIVNQHATQDIQRSQWSEPAVSNGDAQPPAPYGPSSPSQLSPTSTLRPPESPRRPSAHSIREMNHVRRHSSMDVSGPQSPIPGIDKPSLSPSIIRAPHKKQQSLDRSWTLGSSPVSPMSPKSIQSIHPSRRSTAMGSDMQSPGLSSPSLGHSPSGSKDLDRGYMSSGEVESKKTRNVLRKREAASASHSRQSSYREELQARNGIHDPRRHSRVGSADSIRNTLASFTSPKLSHGNSFRNRFRGSSAKENSPSIGSIREATSSVVTKLDSPTTPGTEKSSPSISQDSPTKPTQPVSSSHLRGSLRTVSDSVVMSDKAPITSSPASIPSPIKESSSQSPGRTNSNTNSSTSKSFELDKKDAPAKSPSLMTDPQSGRVSQALRRSSKKETSAYRKGLEEKGPKEQMMNCDYSGWMKKKSPGIMTTWKPRLFVLRGRRLSYYYTENDTEEKGLIDISSHRVLPADNERITGLHAAFTGAKSSPTSPLNSSTPTMNATEAAAHANTNEFGPGSENTFIFKLVPPRTGLSKAVQFTKPAVHYFAVDNVKQGRLWMAALMKATIDRDETVPVQSTYSQKTISLAKARAKKHRPPALMGSVDLDEVADAPDVADIPEVAEGNIHTDDTGLNIHGVDLTMNPKQTAIPRDGELQQQPVSQISEEQEDSRPSSPVSPRSMSTSTSQRNTATRVNSKSSIASSTNEKKELFFGSLQMVR